MEQDEKNNEPKSIELTLPSGEKVSVEPLQKPPKEEIESLEGKIIHPSLDIRDNLVILGFRYRASLKDYENIYLVVKSGRTMLTGKNEMQVEQDGIKETYLVETKNRKLMQIEERWGLKALYKFVDDFVSADSTVPKAGEMGNNIVGLAKKYIDLEKEIDFFLLSAWAIGTYFSPIFSAYPFLNIKAPKGSGKSQCLNFLKQVCFNAIKSRATVAALGDTADALRGTYLIDQADSLNRKGGEELLDILADSYKKSGGKRRVMNMSKGGREVLEFETYGPKAFASINDLPEDLRDRCLVVPLIRSPKNFYDPDDDFENWREIRGEVYKFLVENFSLVNSIYQVNKIQYKEDSETVGRKLELWLPLEVIFNMLGWAEKIEEAKARFFTWYGYAKYEPSEFEEAIITAIIEKFGEEDEIVLSPKEIVDIIETFDRQIFSDAKNEKHKASKVGWSIKKFNLSSEKKKQTKKGVSYVFSKEKVIKIYESYFGKYSTSPTPEQEDEINIDEIPM